MRTIALARVPNQSTSFLVNEVRFNLTIKEARGVMVADVAVAGVTILTGSRLVAGEPVIPYRYLEAGNMFLLTEGGALPTWSEFGVSQTLVYMTADEMEAVRG